jgi:pPIWI RE three-gene island domain Z
MWQGNLFAPPNALRTRLEELKDRGFRHARLLLQVELGFALMEFLHLDDEPVTTVWAILSRTPLYHLRLQNLKEEQQRAIANARQIIPHSARFSWISALRSYTQDIPIEQRNYRLTVENLQNLEQCIINAYKDLQHPIHQNIYEKCLSAQLDFNLRKFERLEAGTNYQFEARTAQEVVTVPISFTQEQLDAKQPIATTWFTPSYRTPFILNVEDLHDDAIYLDEREQFLSQSYGWQETEKGRWVNRFHKISFHKIQEDGELGDRNVDLLELDGFVHLAGMVASGKTTLSLLLAVHVLRHHPDHRLTLVVGDVQSALRLANQINWWFCDNPENDDPVAIPLLGRSKRDAHLKAFYASKDYQDHWRREQLHWGDRWLGTACPLQGLLEPSTIRDYLDGRPIIPGAEPCHSLRVTPRPGRKNKKNLGQAYLCPFFGNCPSQQASRDMPIARIWITTPGAMAMAGLPRHLELRRIKLGELVYEQSNIVIFDEADTVIKWFDDIYAETVMLTNGNDGVFDTINLKTEQYMIPNRVPPSLTQRWTGAERDAQKAITATLTLLDQHSGQKILRDWIQRGYFTPNSLFFKFSRRLAGLEELDPPGTLDAQYSANKRLSQQVMRYFNALLDLSDPLQGQPSNDPRKEPVYRLVQLMRDINSTGESATDYSIHGACKAWIKNFFPNTERRLERLRTKINNRQNHIQQQTKKIQRKIKKDGSDPVDNIETLAYRLQFALTIALLDRHTRIVFYEWHHRPYEVDDEPPHRRMPTAMLNILPLPPTGRQFGTYYSRHEEEQPQKGSGNPLSLFAYTNIGRCYVLNFHRLLTDFDGQRGPNVLALSGTSYLPDSTQFHVGTQNHKPYGVLMPEQTAKAAIAGSTFEFIPQFGRNEEPIRISGSPEKQKLNLFKEIIQSLVGNNGRGQLGKKLEELKQLGKQDSEHWQDRDRLLLLVNSYEQSRWAAKEIQRCWSSMSQKVYFLISDKWDSFESEQEYIELEIGALRRADIEAFGQTDGRILVAPLNAIGRGFNILNANNKAAFGAVYFLTRPYPHPHDTQAIARELNRRALDWANNPDFIAWREDGIQQRAEVARRCAAQYWRLAEYRSYYNTLRNNEELYAFPRRDLAATTAGLIIQAVGRLLRGGVPFQAYFVDAAWAPNYARDKTAEKPRTSLLAAIIDLLEDYVHDDPIGHSLYKPLADAIANIQQEEKFQWIIDPRDKANS